MGDFRKRGEQAEDLALKHYLAQNHILKARRFKSPFAEIDLVLLSPQGHTILVEVKSRARAGFECHRVSRKQKDRLKRAHLYFAGHFADVESHLAIVSQDGRIEVHRDFLAF